MSTTSSEPHRPARPGVEWVAVDWHHDLDDEPVRLYYESDGAGELRKVDVYRDGHCDVAGPHGETGTTFLAWESVPIEEINAQDEFDARPISEDEFDAVYAEALRAHGLGETG